MLAAVALARDVTSPVIHDDAQARAARQRLPDKQRAAAAQQVRQQQNRQRLDATSDPDTRQQQQHLLRRDEPVDQSRHVIVSAQDSVFPPTPPQSAARPKRQSTAERPTSLDLHRTSSKSRPTPTVNVPEVVHTTSGMADVAATGDGDRNESSAAAPRGRRTLMVSDIPGSEPRAEMQVSRSSVAGRSQTPDSGVVVSPLSAATPHPPPSATLHLPPSTTNADLLFHVGPSGPEYRIAQTPTKSTIVIIRNDAPTLPRAAGQPGLATTPSTSSPVRDDPMSITVPPAGVIQPGAVGTVQTVNTATASTSKFIVQDAMTSVEAAPRSAAAGPPYRSFPATTSDERTVVRLNGGDGEHRHYIIAAGTLTAVEPAAATLLSPTGDSDRTLAQPVERRLNEVSTASPAKRGRQNDVDVGPTQAVAPTTPVDPARTRSPTDRVIASSRPKASTPVVKHRDAKASAAAKQKRAPTNAKGQPAQRSKQSQIIAKQQAPGKLTQFGGDKRDSSYSEDSRQFKRSVAELRAVFQAH